jgi:hypothetical protein
MVIAIFQLPDASFFSTFTYFVTSVTVWVPDATSNVAEPHS